MREGEGEMLKEKNKQQTPKRRIIFNFKNKEGTNFDSRFFYHEKPIRVIYDKEKDKWKIEKEENFSPEEIEEIKQLAKENFERSFVPEERQQLDEFFKERDEERKRSKINWSLVPRCPKCGIRHHKEDHCDDWKD